MWVHRCPRAALAVSILAGVSYLGVTFCALIAGEEAQHAPIGGAFTSLASAPSGMGMMVASSYPDNMGDQAIEVPTVPSWRVADAEGYYYRAASWRGIPGTLPGSPNGAPLPGAAMG